MVLNRGAAEKGAIEKGAVEGKTAERVVEEESAHDEMIELVEAGTPNGSVAEAGVKTITRETTTCKDPDGTIEVEVSVEVEFEKGLIELGTHGHGRGAGIARHKETVSVMTDVKMADISVAYKADVTR